MLKEIIENCKKILKPSDPFMWVAITDDEIIYEFEEGKRNTFDELRPIKDKLDKFLLVSREGHVIEIDTNTGKFYVSNMEIEIDVENENFLNIPSIKYNKLIMYRKAECTVDNSERIIIGYSIGYETKIGDKILKTILDIPLDKDISFTTSLSYSEDKDVEIYMNINGNRVSSLKDSIQANKKKDYEFKLN